jgi:hypothetical protein
MHPMMSQGTKAQQLRELLRLSKLLRDHVTDTSDPHYVELFLDAAAALEERAAHLANNEVVLSSQHVDLRC